MAWMEHGLQISLQRLVLSREDEMAAEAFGAWGKELITGRFRNDLLPLGYLRWRMIA